MAKQNKQFSDKKSDKCKPENEIFAQKLNDAILEAELSRKKIAEKTGIGENLLSDYINGTKAPSYLNFQKLAHVLEVPYEYLYGETESMKRGYIGVRKVINLSDKAIDFLSLNGEDKEMMFGYVK